MTVDERPATPTELENAATPHGAPTLLHASPSGPQQVGPYRILSVLGTGGMGIVYRAFDPKLGRDVALKMLHLAAGDEFPEEVLRFRNEAETLGLLQHPNIVAVFDFGMHEGSAYLVMEYIAGGGLDVALRGQPQPPRKAAEMAELLARAVHAAHERGIVHRDLKPANVLLMPDGTPKVTDFGLAKRVESGGGLTQTGAVMGTPSYMAPEQARGKKDVGPPADVYALGAILYEMLTGRPPFRGTTWQETLEQVCADDPAPPSRLVPRLPRDLQTVCLKCLSKSPARRYESALALADDLRAWIDGLPVKARPPRLLERAVRAVARRPLAAVLLLGGAAIVALSAVLAVVVGESRRNAELTRLREEARLRLDEAEASQRRAREHDQAAKNLQEMFDLALRWDLATEAGLQHLHDRLMKESASLEEKIALSPSVRRTPLAHAFLRLAAAMRLRAANSGLRLAALDKAAALASADPGDADARFTLAGVQSELGRAYSDRGRFQEAKAASEAGLKLLKERDEKWTPRRYDRLRSELMHNLAELIARPAPASKEAQRLFEEAADVRRRLAADAPEADDEGDRADHARTLGYLGDVYLEQGDYGRADEAYWESHRIRVRLAEASPKDLARQFQLARSWANHGGYQARRRSIATALSFTEKSQAIREELVRKQPDNVDFIKELAGVLNERAELLLFTRGAAAVAAAAASRAAALMQDVLTADKTRPDDPAARASLAEALTTRARAELVLGRPEDAARDAAEARDHYRAVRPKRSGLGQGLSADELYHEAAALAVIAEVGCTTADAARESLEEAFRRGYRQLAIEEVCRDRAFEKVRDEAWFRDLVKAASP